MTETEKKKEKQYYNKCLIKLEIFEIKNLICNRNIGKQ